MMWLEFREPFNAWSHCAGLLLSLPATFLLWRLGAGSRLKQFSLLIFGLSLTCCYAGSTLYHGVRLPAEEIERFATLDYVGIYLLIAGTTTPLALVVLRGPWQWGTLGITWLVAAGGIGVRVAGVEVSRFHSTGIYFAMGWLVALSYFELARIVSYRAVWPALLGGLLYSAGALLNYHHWPALWPGVFSAHELSHLFVLGGSVSHFWLMVRVVAPSEPRVIEWRYLARTGMLNKRLPQPRSPMANQKKAALRVQIDGIRRYISVPAGRALDLHHYLRSNRVRSAPPEPAYTGFDCIELAKDIDVDGVQALLNAW